MSTETGSSKDENLSHTEDVSFITIKLSKTFLGIFTTVVGGVIIFLITQILMLPSKLDHKINDFNTRLTKLEAQFELFTKLQKDIRELESELNAVRSTLETIRPITTARIVAPNDSTIVPHIFEVIVEISNRDPSKYYYLGLQLRENHRDYYILLKELERLGWRNEFRVNLLDSSYSDFIEPRLHSGANISILVLELNEPESHPFPKLGYLKGRILDRIIVTLGINR